MGNRRTVELSGRYDRRSGWIAEIARWIGDAAVGDFSSNAVFEARGKVAIKCSLLAFLNNYVIKFILAPLIIGGEKYAN